MSTAVSSLLLARIKEEQATATKACAFRHHKRSFRGFLHQRHPGSSQNECASNDNEWQPALRKSQALSDAVRIRNPSLSVVSSLPAEEAHAGNKGSTSFAEFNAKAPLAKSTSAQLQYPKHETENPSLEEDSTIFEDIPQLSLDSLRAPKNHSCELCGKTFQRSSRLKRHFDGVHKGLRDYACGVCGKAFAAKQTLKQHINRVHEGIHPFTCEICGKSYTEMRHLKRHISWLHQKLREYACEVCGKAFPAKQNLKKHINRVHEDLREHSCGSCGKAFVTRQEVERHILRVHQNLREHSCGSCGKAFATKYDLQRHVRCLHQKSSEE